MKRKWFNILSEGCLNLFLILVSIFLLIESSGYPKTARAFPRLVLLFMLILIVMDTFNHVFKAKNILNGKQKLYSKTVNDPSDRIQSQKMRPVFSFRHYRIFFVILLMFAFLLFIHLFGFILSTFTFIIVAPWFLGFRDRKKLLFAAILITGFMYLIFITIMKSTFPQGLLLEYFLR